MEERKLLDDYVFNGRQEIVKPIVANFVFPWIFEIFVSFHSFIHAWSYKAYIVPQVSVAKKTANLTRRKGMVAMTEERELVFVYHVLDIYY